MVASIVVSDGRRETSGTRLVVLHRVHPEFWLRTESPEDPPRFRAVAAMRVAAGTDPFDDRVLDDLFAATNHIDEDWTLDGRAGALVANARSTSVGDVVVREERGVAVSAMRVDPMGWRAVDPPAYLTDVNRRTAALAIRPAEGVAPSFEATSRTFVALDAMTDAKGYAPLRVRREHIDPLSRETAAFLGTFGDAVAQPVYERIPVKGDVDTGRRMVGSDGVAMLGRTFGRVESRTLHFDVVRLKEKALENPSRIPALADMIAGSASLSASHAAVEAHSHKPSRTAVGPVR